MIIKTWETLNMMLEVLAKRAGMSSDEHEEFVAAVSAFISDEVVAAHRDGVIDARINSGS